MGVLVKGEKSVTWHIVDMLLFWEDCNEIQTEQEKSEKSEHVIKALCFTFFFKACWECSP